MSGKFQLEDGERVLVEMEFITGGALGFLMKILGPLLQAEKTAAAAVTDRRVLKIGSDGSQLAAGHAAIQAVYRNTSSDSLAVVTEPKDQSLLIARVANVDAVLAALRDKGVAVEDEMTSPKRRYLR